MRNAFYISDGTAITAEVFGNATLSLFPMEFEHTTIPFVETREKALEVKAQIEQAAAKSNEKPIVFFTFVNPELSEIILATMPCAMTLSAPSAANCKTNWALNPCLRCIVLTVFTSKVTTSVSLQ